MLKRIAKSEITASVVGTCIIIILYQVHSSNTIYLKPARFEPDSMIII